MNYQIRVSIHGLRMFTTDDREAPHTLVCAVNLAMRLKKLFPESDGFTVALSKSPHHTDNTIDLPNGESKP